MYKWMQNKLNPRLQDNQGSIRNWTGPKLINNKHIGVRLSISNNISV